MELSEWAWCGYVDRPHCGGIWEVNDWGGLAIAPPSGHHCIQLTGQSVFLNLHFLLLWCQLSPSGRPGLCLSAVMGRGLDTGALQPGSWEVQAAEDRTVGLPVLPQGLFMWHRESHGTHVGSARPVCPCCWEKPLDLPVISPLTVRREMACSWPGCQACGLCSWLGPGGDCGPGQHGEGGQAVCCLAEFLPICSPG